MSVRPADRKRAGPGPFNNPHEVRRVDSERNRPYRVPVPALLLPGAFCSANLILYWGGFDTTWKLVCAMALGVLLFAFGAVRAGTLQDTKLKSALWIGPWMIGHASLG